MAQEVCEVNRRGFLAALLGTGAAMTLDPERLLWRPGAKLISIPVKSDLICTNQIAFWKARFRNHPSFGRRWDEVLLEHPNGQSRKVLCLDLYKASYIDESTLSKELEIA